MSGTKVQINVHDDELGDTFIIRHECTTFKYFTSKSCVTLPRYINQIEGANKPKMCINIRLPKSVTTLKGHFGESDEIKKLFIHSDNLQKIDNLFEGLQYDMVPYMSCWEKITSAVRTFAHAKIKSFSRPMYCLEHFDGMFAGCDIGMDINIGRDLSPEMQTKMFRDDQP